MNIDQMPAGCELDALIAERVLGWTQVHQIESGDFCGIPPRGVPPYVESHPHYLYILPYYSTDIAAAWEIVKHLAESSIYLCIFDQLGHTVNEETEDITNDHLFRVEFTNAMAYE